MDSIKTASAAPVQGTPKAAPQGKGSPAQYARGKADQVLGGKQQATALADLKKHDYKALARDMGQMTVPQRMAALENMRQKHFGDYQTMINDIRAGKVDDPQLKVGVAIDRLKTTNFSKTDQGQQIVKHLESQYASGMVVVKDKKELGGLGDTVYFGPGDGQEGKKTGSVIRLSTEMSNSPEGAAAVLAHEGMHSQRASEGKRQRPLREETDGNLITAKVWSEFPEDKYLAAATPRGNDLDTTASFYNPDRPNDDTMMKNHIAGRYAHDFIMKNEDGAATGVLRDYFNENSQSKGELIKAAGDEDVSNLLQATQELKENGDSTGWLGKQEAYLQKLQQARANR